MMYTTFKNTYTNGDKLVQTEAWWRTHETLDAARAEAENIWLHLTVYEKARNEVFVVASEKHDVLDGLTVYVCDYDVYKEIWEHWLTTRAYEDIAHDIGYGFGKDDLKALAQLHKEGKCRPIIEDLLTDCNFHCECEKFINGEYDI